MTKSSSLMYSCEEASRMISDALERKLVPSEWVRLRMHLSLCKKCRNYEQNVRMIESTLKQISNRTDQTGYLSDEDKTTLKKNLEALIENESP